MGIEDDTERDPDEDDNDIDPEKIEVVNGLEPKSPFVKIAELVGADILHQSDGTVSIISQLPLLGDNRLPILRDHIRRAHHSCGRNGHRTAEDAWEAGTYLHEVKQIVGHGLFGQWVIDNCEFSVSTANNYMRLAKSNLNSAMIAKMGLAVALQGLSKHINVKRRRPVKGFAGFKQPTAKQPSNSKLPPSKYDHRKAGEQDIRDDETIEEGVLDPEQGFPQPLQPGEALQLNCTGASGQAIVVYIWAVPKGNKPDISFMWIYHEYQDIDDPDNPNNPTGYLVARRFDYGDNTNWTEIEKWLATIVKQQPALTIRNSKFSRLVSDPIRKEILEDFWHFMHDVKGQQNNVTVIHEPINQDVS